MSAPATTTRNNTEVAKSPVESLKQVMAMPSIQEQFKNAMGDNSSLFVASLIDVYASDTYLQACAPALVVMAALKAATLKLPINKSLGFAYIVPYKKKGVSLPQFQVGYKGYIQLAMRTGAYRYINADVVLEGELKGNNKVTGELDISGTAVSDKVIGYFSYIETVNGFKKCVFWPSDKMEAHAKRYSKSYANDQYGTSPWTTNFDSMALKTMLRHLLSKYGVMSVEMVQAFTDDEQADERTPEARLEDDLTANANGPLINLETGEVLAPNTDTTHGNQPPMGEDVPLVAPAWEQ